MKPIEDEETASDLIKIDLKITRWDNLQILLLITLIIMALFVGNRLGYRQGYTYVQDWYETYINKSLICFEKIDGSSAVMVAPSYLGDINISIEIDNETLSKYIE